MASTSSERMREYNLKNRERKWRHMWMKRHPGQPLPVYQPRKGNDKWAELEEADRQWELKKRPMKS